MTSDQPSFGAPKGTRDLLPPESWAFQRITRLGMDMFAQAGYAPVETPVFEHTEVFERGVGETSEVVGKQMYTFTDRGERSLTLRPEGTAPVMRAILEHRLDRGPLPVKLAYVGAMFRQERPQKGRYRQFWQIGIESVGTDSFLADVEVIELAKRFYSVIGLPVELKLNSIGHPGAECRGSYTDALAGFLRDREGELAPEDVGRIETNPMRTFDSKEAATIAVMKDAPVITDHLCNACAEHHAKVRSALEALGISFEDDPRLVRGLDYYTRTAFEFVAGNLGSQSAAGGGGRYDGLAETLGGAPVPGIGFALGLDRILLSLGEVEEPSAVSAYIVALGDGAEDEALLLATRLRSAGIGCEFDVMRRSMKGQMKDAARSGARYAVILGDEERAAGEATIKDLESGEQERVALDGIEGRLTT
jgi:histidyl-tRNA synthetase